MSKKYRQDADVQLIPYYEYDPSIHNVEYRYIPQQSGEGFQDFNNYAFNNANDWSRQPFVVPRPIYGPYGFNPWGFHPWGFHHPWGYHPGFHPGFHHGYHGWHHDSPSR
ncbi:MAG: hypothetical protein WCC10_06340 [Tumebacillaceae bacterium]